MLRRVEIQSYRHALVKSRLQFYQYSLKYAVAQVLAERDFNCSHWDSSNSSVASPSPIQDLEAPLEDSKCYGQAPTSSPRTVFECGMALSRMRQNISRVLSDSRLVHSRSGRRPLPSRPRKLI